MIAGVGMDIVDVAHFATLVGPRTERARFVTATFTPDEVRYCESEAHGDPIVHMAARFAAKEATLKALDAAAAALQLSPAQVPLLDVEVVRDARGRPTLKLDRAAQALMTALEIDRLHLSLTHDGGVAGAVVVAERRG